MERSNTWSIPFKTIQKILQIHKKSKFHKQAQVWLQSGQMQKAKSQRRELVGTTATVPIHERRSVDIESSAQNFASYDFSNCKNWILSSRPSFTNTKLVWWSMESLFGCRRRFEKNISIALLIREEFFTSEFFRTLWMLKDWKLEKFCMKDHTCLLDHHQRSHWDTITIVPGGMMNWFLQLNNSQSAKLSDSLVEKHHVSSSPVQDPDKSVIDQRNLIERKMCLLLKVKRPHEIDEKLFHEELGSSDRSGKLEKLYENTRVEETHDGSGQPVERNNSSAHTVKVKFVPEENRDIASFNVDNEFNRAINEENIVFNIQECQIQQWNNHMAPLTIQSFQQSITRRGWSSWKHWIVWILDVEPKAQCKACLTYWGRWHRLLHVRALHTRWYDREQEVHQVHFWPLFDSQRLHQERSTTRSPLREERRGSRVLNSPRINSKRSVRNDNSWAFTIDSFVIHGSERPWSNWVALKKWFVRWRNWRTKITHTTLLKKKLVCTATIGGSVRILLVPSRCP